MKKEEIYKGIEMCLNNIGIMVEGNIEDRFLDQDIEDSLTYVSFIVELEEKFCMSIQDEYLQANILESYGDVANMIILTIDETD